MRLQEEDRPVHVSFVPDLDRSDARRRQGCSGRISPFLGTGFRPASLLLLPPGPPAITYRRIITARALSRVSPHDRDDRAREGGSGN